MIDHFENKLTHNGIHYSRYIASWKQIGGRIYRGGLFERWLREKEQLTDAEIADILRLTDCGKLELERSAELFVKENANAFEEEEAFATYGDSEFNEFTGRHITVLRKLWTELKDR